MTERFHARVQLYGKVRYDFQQLFGVSLKPFWDNLLGFDLVKFDDEIIKSGDEAMRDVVASRYGQEAVTLLEKLISA